MNPSQRLEPVSATLCLEDWGAVLAALSTSTFPLVQKERISRTVFDAARSTSAPA